MKVFLYLSALKSLVYMSWALFKGLVCIVYYKLFYFGSISFEENTANLLANFFLYQGPLFIKLGQLFACNTEIFSKTIINKLLTLYVRVKPMSDQDLQYMLKRNHSIMDKFHNFDMHPTTCDSVSQVHCATLKHNDKH